MIGYIRIIATPCFLGCPCEKIFIQSNKLFSRAALFAQVIHSDYRADNIFCLPQLVELLKSQEYNEVRRCEKYENAEK